MYANVVYEKLLSTSKARVKNMYPVSKIYTTGWLFLRITRFNIVTINCTFCYPHLVHSWIEYYNLGRLSEMKTYPNIILNQIRKMNGKVFYVPC